MHAENSTFEKYENSEFIEFVHGTQMAKRDQ